MPTLENHDVLVEADLGNGLRAIFVPPVKVNACEEMRITEASDMLYFSCALHFCQIAHVAYDVYWKQERLEEETDFNANLRQALESNMRFYGVDDIQRVANFFPRCREYAFRHSIAWYPEFQAWIDSAGRAYNEVTREEKKWDTMN